MGLPSWVRDQIRMRYATAFSYDVPQYQLIAIDNMQFLKGSLPDWVTTLRHLRSLMLSKVDQQFKSRTGCQVVVMCFDRDSPVVKKLVVHKKRYEIRCDKCKTHAPREMERGTVAPDDMFSPDCERSCKDKQIMWAEQGPYLDPAASLDQPLPDWTRFSADSRNLRREIYPLVMNWLMQYQFHAPGLMIITHGLPGKTRTVRDAQPDFDQGHHIDRDFTTRHILMPWTPQELPVHEDHHDFSRVYMIKAEHPTFEHPNGMLRVEEVPEMRNNIQEADNAVFFYSRFFPEFKTCMAYINDGDAISIGLLRSCEDFTGGPQPEKEQWLALKYAKRDVASIFLSMNSSVPTMEYVNLTLLYQKIQSSEDFVRRGYQSPVATLVFLLILAGSDFFQGEWCYGIGGMTSWSEDEDKRAKQTPGFWDTFFEKMEMFPHLIQYYTPTKSLTERRLIVLDEELFKDFTGFCYIGKHAKSALNKRRKKDKHDGEVTQDEIRLHCSKFKDERKHFPTPDKVRRWARQIQWNLNYWANAFRDIDVDPYEEHMGKPYWGYHKDHGIVDEVSPKQKGLDEVHKRHMLKRERQKPDTERPQVVSAKRRKLAMEAIRGK